MEINESLISLAGVIVTFLFGGGLYKYNNEKKKAKLELENLELENQRLRIATEENTEKISFYDNIIKLVFINAISEAVQGIFKDTIADRFLILIARNGKTDFKYVDVIFEFHKDKKFDIDAVKIYKNVEIDNPYRQMLKNSEHYGFVDIETKRMEKQVLKHFYEFEKVNFSKVKPVMRKPIDEGNDFLVFTSTATHEDRAFNDIECAIIDRAHNGIIKPNIEKLLN